MKISKINPFLFLLFTALYVACTPSQNFDKINGMSMVASRNTINEAQAEGLKNIGANFVAVMPYGFMPSLNTPEVFFDKQQQWSGETLKGIEEDIKTLQSKDLQVMLKPHIWIGGGEFTGFISMTSEEDWKKFETNYKDYIIRFAKLAEKNKVALFCLGTEMNKFVTQRSEFWDHLIKEVRTVYSGKITYAENWDKYTNVNFWDDLDFIGIDAYFPISDSKTPSLEEINSAWTEMTKDMKDFSKEENTQILFTEYGYRSADFAGKEPWDSSRKDYESNETAQLNLLKGLHQNLWDKDWFAGGFLWKWFPYHDRNSKRHQNRFTVQAKISEEYIRSFYNKN